MIYPAIDLINGACVRLTQGDFSQQTLYDISPIIQAKAYAQAGAKWAHIVDLDGAKQGNLAQSELLIEIAKQSALHVQTGGGIRELSQIQHLLENGIARVVIGSLAVTDPQLVISWLEQIGGKQLVLALDVNIGGESEPYPAIRGWTQNTGRTLWQVLDGYAGTDLQTILVTDISKDGVLGGANTKLYQQIMRRYPNLNLITSGGVGTLSDVVQLKTLNPYGIIIGKALYENRFSVEQAIQC
ncbi:MAG: 1-(5-phosphoribosyl)-5-[(5-phosphoribosylamino)methylideneamino]imidazole-4-carboxamide isomerase [Robiginitomaculum sp.]|nr:1-(5-phosphoribosyl)-5-[(5-phosphoribosylamino)methylideneamino]imidazole-4-carboxamide isomerase [Robiginitomaculum sp.]